jgi:hypothetical protein
MRERRGRRWVPKKAGARTRPARAAAESSNERLGNWLQSCSKAVRFVLGEIIFITPYLITVVQSSEFRVPGSEFRVHSTTNSEL